MVVLVVAALFLVVRVAACMLSLYVVDSCFGLSLVLRTVVRAPLLLLVYHGCCYLTPLVAAGAVLLIVAACLFQMD